MYLSTTPSLAFGIIRKHYLPFGKTIPIFKGRVFEFLRESFTGGSTEMYNPRGKDLYCYDVNSLYPTVMANNRFPVGQTWQFNGDINLLWKLDSSLNGGWRKDESHWIGEAAVNTKEDLYQPYLQINHLRREHGFGDPRTVSCNGSFTMKINSCEYYNAEKDYDIKISSGFLWKADFVFQEFVNDLYQMRLSYPKSDPMNTICKWIMNSAYGRFAMKPIAIKTKFIKRDENIFDFLENNEIVDFEDIIL